MRHQDWLTEQETVRKDTIGGLGGRWLSKITFNMTLLTLNFHCKSSVNIQIKYVKKSMLYFSHSGAEKYAVLCISRTVLVQ